jgi:hypothetical protein
VDIKVSAVLFNDHKPLFVGYSHNKKRLVEFCKGIPLLTIDPSQRLKQEIQELTKDYFAELGDLRE